MPKPMQPDTSPKAVAATIRKLADATAALNARHSPKFREWMEEVSALADALERQAGEAEKLSKLLAECSDELSEAALKTDHITRKFKLQMMSFDAMHFSRQYAHTESESDDR